jgi:ABC-type Fe3+ transport system substrate-binding protein
MRRFSLAVLTLIAVVVSPAGPRGVSAQPNDDLYAKAKTEGRLTIYAGGPTAPWEAAAARFKARYPGIEVAVTGGFSNVLDTSINQQLHDGKMDVDIAFLQTVADFVDWKRAGVLLPFRPEAFALIDNGFKDADGAYVGVEVNVMPYAYNSTLVKPADVPRSALDFLKPEWRGKLVAAYPADDDATLYVFDSIVKKYGWSYMDRYMANQPKFIQGHLPEQRSVSSGATPVTLDSIVSITLGEQAAGKPIRSAFSAIDPIPIWALTGAIFQGSPHPNAAKLFLNYFLSPDEQSRLGTWSVRADVPPPAGLKPLSAYHVVNSYRDFLSDRAAIAALRKRYEQYTGPVVNTGGVR